MHTRWLQSLTLKTVIIISQVKIYVNAIKSSYKLQLCHLKKPSVGPSGMESQQTTVISDASPNYRSIYLQVVYRTYNLANLQLNVISLGG